MDTLCAHLSQKLGSRCRLLVAFSGGLDSTVLLHALVVLKRQYQPALQLRAVHVHHGLSPHADAWVQHCRYWCQQWQVPFSAHLVQIDARDKGIEAGARQARYTVFAKELQAGECLLTAQHLDDQSETFLLALKRGSGPTGLAGMAEQSDFIAAGLSVDDQSAVGGELIRPLLTLSRQQLASYAEQQGLAWIDDDSNQNDRFDRNFLRLRILPRLQARWPHFASAVARSARLCGEQEALLDEVLAELLSSCVDQQGALAIAGLRALSPLKRKAILRRWISSMGAEMPSEQQLSRIWQEVALSRRDAEPCLQLGCWQIRRFRDSLYWLPMMQTVRDWQASWDGETALVLPDNLGRLSLAASNHHEGIAIRAPTEHEQVSVRFQAQGVFRITGRNHGHKIKKIWQELGVPPWQRERIPLIYFNEQLIAALGAFVTQQGQSVVDQPIDQRTLDNQSVWWIEWNKS